MILVTARSTRVLQGLETKEMMLNILRPLRMEAALPKEAERIARRLLEVKRLLQAIDLGQVAARLKEDAVICSKDNLWILQELQSKDNDVNFEDGASLARNCVVRSEGKISSLILACNGCNRWVHGDCIGIRSMIKLIEVGFVTAVCRNQIEFLYADNKDQTNGTKSFSECKFADQTKGTKSFLECEFVEKVGMMKREILIVQQILLHYLQELAVSDCTAASARRILSSRRSNNMCIVRNH